MHASDLSPAAWPHEPSLEWAAAGDGALYAALHDSGVLDSLLRQVAIAMYTAPCSGSSVILTLALALTLRQDYRYMFVSDVENLAASFDLKLLSWFVASGAPIALEVCEHAAADGEQCAVLARDASGGRGNPNPTLTLT